MKKLWRNQWYPGNNRWATNSTGNTTQPTTSPEENERAIMSLLGDGPWDEIDTQIPTDEIRSAVATSISEYLKWVSVPWKMAE